MENRPIIHIIFSSSVPGADAELWQRYQQWATGAYQPMIIKVPEIKGFDFYNVLKENPEYPSIGSISHYENLKAREDSFKAVEMTAVGQDISTWTKRGVWEGVWSAVYELEKGFRSEPGLQGGRADTRIDSAPIVHLEGYRLSPEEQVKYDKWLGDYGYNVFMPLFMRLPGLKGFDFFRHIDIDVKLVEVRETEYPSNLSIMYFETLKAFEAYTKSLELVAYQKAVRTVFPRGLNYKWYVQYQLIKSLRK